MNIAFRVLQLNSGKTYSRKLLLGRGKFFCVLEAWKSKPVAALEQCGSQWLGLFATPALAHGGWNSGNDVNVNNNNTADVSNGVLVIANSGGNTADGSSGGDGGNGGDVGYDGCNNECDNEVDDGNTGGNGGDGGTGGDGGIIVTGDAGAGVSILNDVKYNETDVSEGCGCEDDEDEEDGDTNVNNNNSAHVTNRVGAIANSGHNNANGDSGGNGGNGGGN